jgi:hypothetical protein
MGSWLRLLVPPHPVITGDRRVDREAARMLRRGRAITNPAVAYSARLQQRFLIWISEVLALALLVGIALRPERWRESEWIGFGGMLALLVVLLLFVYQGWKTLRATNRYESGG